jgi:8-oxo-dGTP pyrophosphatase MutT (NUDIX family)
MKYNTATPYAASYVILRKGNKVAFVLKQNTAWMNGYYGLPSGKVEKEETFTNGAVREAQEEIGVEISKQSLQPVLLVHRHTDETDWVDMYFEAETWKGEPYNAEPDVHSELAWLDLAALPDNVIPSVVAALQAITNGQTYSEYGWE